MSLSTRVYAGIGAVVLIAAGTVGGSIAYANSEGKPAEHQATLVVGRSSQTASPLCYDDGKPLAEEKLAKCQADIKKATEEKTIPSSDVVSSDRIGVGVPESASDNGWYAYTDGGAQGQAVLAPDVHGTTYSGSHVAADVLNATGTTTVTVVESNQKTKEIYAVWIFNLHQQG